MSNILSIIINSGLITSNEISQMEGLMFDSGELTAQEFNDLLKLGTDWGIYGNNKTQNAHGAKTACPYCTRPNGKEHDLCQSCGAPLPIL